MADDPIIKYFQENLTEAEEEALAERLRTSTEDALRFGQHAEAAYRHYGLPEPVWGQKPSSKGSFGKWGSHWELWLVLFLNFGLLSLGFFLFLKTEKPFEHTSAISQVVAQEASAEVPEMTHPNKTRLNTAVPEADPAEETGEDPITTASAAIQRPQEPPQEAMVLPVQVSPRVPRPHPNLEVVIHRAKPTYLAVRVLDPQGQQAVLLYRGNLNPGTWAFDWDGKRADGSAPSPGTYRIQVESSGVTQGKNVVIH